LKQIDAWTFGKCELFHWIDVLDISDSILEEAATRSSHNPWELACDLPQNREVCLINDLFFKESIFYINFLIFKLITKYLLLYFILLILLYLIISRYILSLVISCYILYCIID